MQALRIEKLTAATSEDIERIGGKACGLVRLMGLGVRVPEAWVLEARTVKSGAGTLAPELVDALAAFWWSLQAEGSGCRLAVRSSATAEDLAGASFAGIYHTQLNVACLEDLLAAAHDCLAALHSHEAEAYRAQRGFTREPRIALVIQRMVAADTAGVLMTVNPVRPFAGEMVIDAAHGLGEGVVSGKVHPDHCVLDAATGALRSPPDGDALCLSAAQLAELWSLGRGVQSALGQGQDIEWAYENGELFVLQQRPMVGLPPTQPKSVYSRRFGDEYIADYALPLSYDVLMPWISEVFLMDFARMFGFEKRLTEYPVKRHEGYAYISGEYVEALLACLPKGLRRPESIGWFEADWDARIRAAPFRPRQLAGMVWAGFKDPFSSMRKNRAQLAAHCESLRAEVVPLLEQNYHALGDAEWHGQFRRAMELGDAHFRVIRWGMGFHNPALHGFLRELLAKWAGDADGALYRALITGLPGSKTSEVNRRIWELASQADGREDAFERFLAEHGHRGSSRDIAHPRWAETPDVVRGLVEAVRRKGSEREDGVGRARQARLAAEAEVFRRVGALKRPVMRWALEGAQAYTLYREDQRFYLDYLLFHIRKLVLEAAERLVENGALANIDDVFFLHKEEFLGLMAPGPGVSADHRGRGAPRRASTTVINAVHTRRAHFERARFVLPATFLYDGMPTEGPASRDVAETPNGWGGMPVSAGRVEGPARVVTELAGLHAVHPGEILVAPNTDPGWTSVFPLLAGLVTETGGMLSHGALLAREYGIPAVTGLPGATTLIKTGDRLLVDANTGAVTRLD